MRPIIPIPGFVLAFALLCAPLVGPAQATVVHRIDLNQLVMEAHVVVHGVVVRTGTQGAVRGNALPYTVAQVQVREWIAGDDPRPELLVREPGARVGAQDVVLHGAPRYREGDEVVLFLMRDGSYFRTLGLAQGCYFVDPTKDGPAQVSRRTDALAFAERARDGRTRVFAAEPDLPAALPALLASIRALVEYRP